MDKIITKINKQKTTHNQGLFFEIKYIWSYIWKVIPHTCGLIDPELAT